MEVARLRRRQRIGASAQGRRGQCAGARVRSRQDRRLRGGDARSCRRTLPEDYEISFWMRAEAGRNNFEVKFVDASGDNVWWFRRANYQFSGDWQQVRIKRRQIEFAWGPTTDRTLRQFQSIEFVVSAGDEGGKGSLWFDRLSLKPLRPQRAVPPADRACIVRSERQRRGARHRRQDEHDVAQRANRRHARRHSKSTCKAVREFGGIEIDWARGLHAPRYSIETSLDGSRWKKVRSIDASNGGRDSHLMPESEARYIRADDARSRAAMSASPSCHVRDLRVRRFAERVHQSLAKQTRDAAAIRAPYLERADLLDDRRRRRRHARRACCPRTARSKCARAAISVEPFIRTRDELAHVGRRGDSGIRWPTAICRSRASSGSIARSS